MTTKVTQGEPYHTIIMSFYMLLISKKVLYYLGKIKKNMFSNYQDLIIDK